MRKLVKVFGIALLSLCISGVIGVTEVAANTWKFGIGTGFVSSKHKGTVGFNTVAFGALQYDIDMDPDDYRDLISTMFGFSTFATNGELMFTLMLKGVKLKGDAAGDLSPDVGGGTFALESSFKKTKIQSTVGYTVFRSEDEKFSITPNVGVRYFKHETETDYVFVQGGVQTNVSGEHDINFTDFLLGVSVGYVVSPKVSLAASGGTGLGDTENSSTATASLNWRVWKHITLTPSFVYSHIKFQQGAKGEEDWYFYDMDETGIGIGLMYNF